VRPTENFGFLPVQAKKSVFEIVAAKFAPPASVGRQRLRRRAGDIVIYGSGPA
jgi:hypothetical protein